MEDSAVFMLSILFILKREEEFENVLLTHMAAKGEEECRVE